MTKQQEMFANLQKHEDDEIRKMEEQEKKRLEDYNNKKKLERNRKNARKTCHQKLCCR